jgi:hypothetical protein
MSKILSGTAIIISLAASLISGFTIYKMSTIEKKVDQLSSIEKKVDQLTQYTATQSKTVTNPTPVEVTSNTTSNTIEQNVNTTPVPVSVSEIQPGQFINNALKDNAQVELLSVKRIPNPETNVRDIVNVQFRVRSLKEAHPSRFGVLISPLGTAARNPDTSEAFKTARVRDRQTYTGTIPVGTEIAKGGSADAYVWLKVPEDVKKLDIYIPETKEFKNVPIAQ